MKLSLAVPLLALLATNVAGDNCKKGLNYWGRTLLSIGDYLVQTADAMRRGGWNTDTYYQFFDDFLFECVGGPNGDVRVLGLCLNTKLTGRCFDAGKGKSDYCRERLWATPW